LASRAAFRFRYMALVLPLLATVSTGAGADGFASKDEVLRNVFPDADRFEEKLVTLDDKQVKIVQALARAELPSRLVTEYVGWKQNAVTGYAFIDSPIVRTLPGTLMVALSPDGSVRNVEILAFYEPPDYLPMKPWLRQFDDRKLNPALKLHGEINGIAGATMSSQAVVGSVRRALALYQVLVKGKE